MTLSEFKPWSDSVLAEYMERHFYGGSQWQLEYKELFKEMKPLNINRLPTMDPDLAKTSAGRFVT